MRVSAQEFDELLRRAMDQLPEEFAAQVHNVAVVSEDEPTPEDLAEVGMAGSDDELLGLYRGIPLPERDAFYASALPDQVVLFRGPLLRFCRTRRELLREIRDTLVHELGHYFGLSDDEMPY